MKKNGKKPLAIVDAEYFINLNKGKKKRKMKHTPREIKEANAHYEKVIEHLISEGYTRDREGAESIISGMSEEWYSLIVTD